MHGQVLLHEVGQLLFGTFGIPRAVVEERAVVLEAAEAVVFVQVAGHVHGYEVGRTYQIGSGQRAVAKTQVRAGVAAGLLAVVVEIGLAVLIGVVADNLNGVLVGTYRTICAEAVEAGFEGALGQDGDFGQEGKRTVGDVVHNADGELVALLALHVVEDADDLRRGCVLAGETVAATDDGGLAGTILEGFYHIHVERVAVGTGLFGAVEHADGLHMLHQALRHGLHEVLHAEGTIEMHGHNAGLLALGVEIVHHRLDGLGNGTDGDDNVLGIGGTVVGEGSVVTTGYLANLLHVVGHDVGQGIVVFVLYFASLEIDVAILSGAAGYAVLGVEGAVAESLQCLLVNEGTQVFHIHLFHLLYLVRGAEAVEEVHERHAALDGSKVSHRSEVHYLLHRGGGQHGEAGLARSHHVGMVAEDGESLGSQRTSRYVEHAGQQLAGNLIHVGNHQQETLRGGVGGGESTGLQRAVHGTGSTGLRFHLDYLNGFAEQVFAATRSPFIDVLGHRRRRRDGVDGGDLTKHVCYGSSSTVAVACHKLFFFCHFK